MAWVATDNFDSYSNGDLNGGSGGSSWSTNWSGSTSFDVQGTTVYQGSKAITNTNNGEVSIQRTFSAVSDGVVYFAVRKTSNSAGGFLISLRNSSDSSRGYVFFDNSSNIIAGTGTVLSGYSANTWYVIRLTFNATLGTYSAAYSTDAFGTAGTFSADSTPAVMGNTGDITRIQFAHDYDGGTGVTSYFDYISPTSPFVEAPTSINVSDQLNLTESVTVSVEAAVVSISTSDQLNITESISRTLIDNISVSDQLNLTEGSGSTVTSGPDTPGTVADDATVGSVSWSNPTNAKTNNGQYATASFGFTSNVVDSEVKIVKADGSIGSTNKADTGTDWSLSNDVVASYGANNDLWGETWTAADINDSDFGAVIAANSGGTITHYLKATNLGFSIPTGAQVSGIKVEIEKARDSTKASIDFIRITVYYLAPVHVEVTSFPSVLDQLNVSESFMPELSSLVSVSDQLNITESITAFINPLYVSVSDQLTLTESTTVLQETITLSVSDQITLSEDVIISQETSISISVSDSITTTESVQTSLDTYLSVSDQLTLTEQTSFALDLFVSLSDQLNITESVTVLHSETRRGISYLRGRDQDRPNGLQEKGGYGEKFRQGDYPLGLNDSSII